jgi:hypothetical protein
VIAAAMVKREMLTGIDKGKVLLVVEDRTRVVQMWREEGLVCLQCAPGEFDAVGSRNGNLRRRD